MRYFKKEISLVTVLLLLITLAVPVDAIEYVEEPEITFTEEYAEDQVIIQFDPSIDKKTKENHKKEFGLKLKKNLGKKGLEVHKLTKNKNVEEVITKLNKKKGVLFAEPDYILRAIESPAYSNDTYFEDLWGLDNTNDYDIDAPEAWDIQPGGIPSVIVAVIDTGVYTDHADLNDNDKELFVRTPAPDGSGMNIGWDFYNNDNTVFDSISVDDHGTHVTGTIAANDNAIGVIGVAPNVKIMPLKFLGSQGGYTSDAILAINYASEYGAHIINASWGGGGFNKSLKDAIADFPGLFVAAAGNGGSDGIGDNTDDFPHYPSSYDLENIVSVAATDSLGKLTSFSNFGSESVDVGAPGSDILSTIPYKYRGRLVSAYSYYGGTSMATPHVSGIVALMLSQKTEIMELLDSHDELIVAQAEKALTDALFSSKKGLTDLYGKTTQGVLVSALDALEEIESFTEPVVNDTAPPTVVTSESSPTGTDVDINTIITVTFDEPLDETYWDLSNITIPGVVLSNASVSFSSETLILTPDEPLENATTYTVTLSTDAVRDVAGNKYVGEYSFEFTTVNPPTINIVNVVSDTVPTNKTRNVTSSDIVIIFNQEVALNYSGNNINEFDKIKILDKLLTPVTFTGYAFDVNESEEHILTLYTDGLAPNMRYTIQLQEGAFKTTSGILSDFYTSVFTTKK